MYILLYLDKNNIGDIMLKSIWNDYIDNKSNILNKNLETNTLVIGGGICGVLTTYFLKKNGIECVLVEKDKLGSGITKNTTAVLSAQEEILYKDRIKKIDFNKAKDYLHSHLHTI